MPRFTVKVPDGDEGYDLGEYESDYLPRVGDPFALWHPAVCGDSDEPFAGIVHEVAHEAHRGDRVEGDVGRGAGTVHTTVWIVEELAVPYFYCDCTPKEREKHGVTADACDRCGYPRRA